jgi:hypothetical protein
VPFPENLFSRIKLISELAAGQAAGLRTQGHRVGGARHRRAKEHGAAAETRGAARRPGRRFRPLVEAGWIAYEHQIGQTGCSVSPDLLITFGVSGAIQHLAGIGGAKKIIAVNSDPEAPIFQVAHYRVVGDCQEVLREMIACLKAKRERETA